MCAVAGEVISDHYMEGWYILPGNVVVGTGTREEVLAAYGEPTSEQDGVLTYELEPNRYVKLTLQDNILVEAEIFNMINSNISYDYSSFYVRFNEGSCVRYRYITSSENKDAIYCDIIFS